jgi:hypothetical protein
MVLASERAGFATRLRFAEQRMIVFGPRNGVCQHRIFDMIRKLKSGQFRLYSRKKNPGTGKRRNLGTFSTIGQAKQHEREVQYFKRH